MHLTYVALHEVTWCMIVWCTSNVRRWQQFHVAPASTCQRCKHTTSVDIQKCAIKKEKRKEKKASHSCRITCERSESARVRRIVLYKSDQQQQHWQYCHYNTGNTAMAALAIQPWQHWQYNHGSTGNTTSTTTSNISMTAIATLVKTTLTILPRYRWQCSSNNSGNDTTHADRWSKKLSAPAPRKRNV